MIYSKVMLSKVVFRKLICRKVMFWRVICSKVIWREVIGSLERGYLVQDAMCEPNKL